jgi:hypothetical protein
MSDVACNRYITVTLYPTQKAAQEALEALDKAFCGGCCPGGWRANHWIEDMEKHRSSLLVLPA